MNYNLLIEEIKSKSSYEEMANVLDINLSTLYRKIGGHTKFSVEEAIKIKEHLNLSKTKANSIFFGD